MKTPKPSPLLRRDFLLQGSRSLACFLLGPQALPLLAQSADPEPLFRSLAGLGELQPPDHNGIRLPRGFRSRVIARSRQPVVGTGHLWHDRPDGGACFAAADGGWVYVSNSERRREHGGGGVGAIHFDAQGNIVAARSILQGSDYNCAGGKTPWQTWLSCEEVERGLVWECDPSGRRPAEPRPALGRFRHEAVAVDSLQGHLYLTEDLPDGCLYRFVPAAELPDLSQGCLQVAVAQMQDGRTWLRWQTLPDAAAEHSPTRYQIPAALRFDGGEGCAWQAGKLYFTTKGDNCVWCLDTTSSELTLLYDRASSPTPLLSGVDNLTITASGDVLVAEDGGDMQLVLLGPEGLVLPVLQVQGQPDSELCGPAFDPSFQRLYFSSQRGPYNRDDDGITYEISRFPI
jgi:hypothetical protein